MEIRALDADLTDKYNELALTYGSIFQTTHWTKIFGKGIQHYGIFDKGSELIGGFFLFSKKLFGMSIYLNPPFTPSIGPFLKVNARTDVRIMSIWKEIMSLLSNFFDSLSFSVMSFSLNTSIIDMQPFIWNKFKVIPGYTYLMDLSWTENDLIKKMSNERRKNITKANKDALEARQLQDYSIIKDLVCKTYSRQKIKLDSNILHKVLVEFANSKNSFAFGTYNKEEPIACTFCIHDNYSAYYLLGGYDSENKHHGGGSLSMWESIKYAKSMGLKSFDFEGSMTPQIERYFRGFGGRLTPYYRINKAKLPIEILLKFFKRELF